MANTFVQIGSTVTVGSGGAASISFTSIPSTYTDLMVLYSLRSDRAYAFDNVSISFNGSGATKTDRRLFGDGAATNSYSDSELYMGVASDSSATASVFGNCQLYIFNYTSANHKSALSDGISENNNTTAAQEIVGGKWSNTAVINAVALAPRTGSNWLQYSTASLYGILKY